MSEEEVKSERIYIGGLEPPQLRPSDVQKRLKSLDGIEIISVAIDDSKTFYHITARPLKNDDVTALAIVSKNYNNVKWKGCKLSVKGARPHFLDKLRKEYADRQPAAVVVAAETKQTEPKEEEKVVPRRLRIRQKYGEEAHRVDTKPCETTDWTSFTKIVSKMRQRRERKSKGTKEDKTVSFYNRAVHMSFNDDGTAEAPPPLVHDNKGEASEIKFDSKAEKAAASSDESDDSDSDDSDKEEENLLKSKHYDWSSDEGDSDEEADAAPSKADKVVVADIDVVAPKEKVVVADKAEDDEKSQPEETPSNEPSKKTFPNNDESNGYEWSSDEDGSEEEIVFRTVKAEQEPVSEFASAINFDEDDEDESDDEDVFPGIAVELDGPTEDLEKDVATNLDVLSQLFPDLKQNVPKQIDPAEGVKPKWAATPTMQRYDPTKESAQQFEIKKDSADEESDSSSSASSSDDSDDDEKPEPKPIEESVYHEAKLEEVFRNARDTGEAGGFQVSSMFGEQPDELKEKEKLAKPEEAPTGAFSFNFELASAPAAAEEKASDDSKFSYGFDVVDPADAITKTDEPEKEKEDEVMATTVDEPPQPKPEPEDTAPVRPRRRGFLPPSEVVDEFYNKFFELNDGIAIQENPDGFRNNEEVKAAWKEERYTLTQDWKRKRKYAQSRLQKKYKFR
jgi:hypothetical protein